MSPQFSLALITGATSGIGLALCELLSKKQIPFIATGRNEQALDDIKKKFSNAVPLETFPCDLTDRTQRKQLLDLTQKKTPDLTINSAGFGLYGEALAHPSQDHLHLIEVNVSALVELNLRICRSLIARKQKGVIMNVSSAAAFASYPYFATYAASKSFVNSFSQAFDEEVKDHGIRVLTTCPGPIATGFQKRASLGKSSIQKMPGVMASDFAAKEIWEQITKGTSIHTFDWRYRIAAFTSQILPQKFLNFILKKRMRTLTTDH